MARLCDALLAFVITGFVIVVGYVGYAFWADLEFNFEGTVFPAIIAGVAAAVLAAIFPKRVHAVLSRALACVCAALLLAASGAVGFVLVWLMSRFAFPFANITIVAATGAAVGAVIGLIFPKTTIHFCELIYDLLPF